MFKVNPEATFDAALTIRGQGRVQTLNVTFRRKPRTEYTERLAMTAETDDEGNPKLAIEDLVLELVEKWDADVDLTPFGVREMSDWQPGIPWAIVHGYSDAMGVAYEGNSAPLREDSTGRDQARRTS